MPDVIRDGEGRGYLAGVNSKNRLLVRTTSVQQCLKSVWEANYFEATSGKVTLTDANEKGIIYLRNDRTDNAYLIVDRCFFDVWPSTNGTGGGTLLYYRNPTVTGGTIITPNNTLFSQLSQATGTFLKSLTTMTGTAWWTAYVNPGSSVELVEGRMTIPPGYSFGISVQAPAGNTSMVVSLNVAFYFIDLALVE
jgi:hypothetical protein